ncbi:2'-5' RNA ligase family protein [Myceligenerans pegani]|uniref:2'-5' RNA ligase family protein n=1 Tax=Myceligenerans pegani TaxID=2776917 RepID=A0ABR9MVZ1_9MICO|nr:2'-5' RNA ligase family protein [Myceligenerans sp. TRM 65318]MBE1875550.1 2'-5' RNA ligase family protein [Myceligenerans sp. TRM 65318]MBE3017821.1 2'-5' RNA ligase family protein [Myceligenerans sp. TRM 65318]
MALAVCLLFDGPTDRVLRRLWQRLEDDGVPTLATHTHGRHVPHLSLAVLRSWDLDKVRAAVEALPDAGPVTVRFDAVAAFRRGRMNLIPAVTSTLATRQERLVDALGVTEDELHMHYVPGVWTPHVTLAPRVRLEQTPLVLEAAYEILPLTGRLTHAALVDAGTGAVHPLSVVP